MQSGSTEQASREIHICAVLVILIVTTLPYLNSFQGVFDFDDVRHITENTFIRIQDFSWSSIAPIFKEGPSHQRWLPMLSLAANYYAGGYEVFGYHLFNLVTHLLTAFLLYYFFCLILTQADEYHNSLRIVEISLVSVLLWSLHPVQTNAVTYVVQRMTSMASMFSVASCICYMRGRISTIQVRRWLWWLGAVFLWFLALSSKENSAILPFVILGLDYYFFRKPEEGSRVYIVFLAFAGVAGILVALFFLSSNPIAVLQTLYAKYNFNMGERLLSEATIIFYYIGLLLLPLPSRLNLSYDYPVSRSLIDPLWTLPSVIGIFILVLLIFLLFKKHRLLSFAIFWFLVNLVIESSVFPVELIYEHRLYFPSTVLILAAVTYIYRIQGKRIIAIRVCLVLLCLLFATGTWQRNKVWGSVENLWTDVVEKSPNITRGYVNLGRTYNHQGRFEESLPLLRKGLEIDPGHGLLWLNLGYIYVAKNQLDEALSAYNKALLDGRMGGDAFKVHSAMAITYIKKNQPELALAKAEQALRLDPNFPKSWLFKGVSHGMLGQHKKALASGRRAVALDPQFIDAYLLVARAYDHLGNTREAVSLLNQGIAARGGDPTGLAQLRDTLSRKLTSMGQ